MFSRPIIRSFELRVTKRKDELWKSDGTSPISVIRGPQKAPGRNGLTTSMWRRAEDHLPGGSVRCTPCCTDLLHTAAVRAGLHAANVPACMLANSTCAEVVTRHRCCLRPRRTGARVLVASDSHAGRPAQLAGLQACRLAGRPPTEIVARHGNGMERFDEPDSSFPELGKFKLRPSPVIL